MSAQKHSIGFIGLGAMGFGMASNLVRQGYNVTGFDIWGPTLEKFASVGGLVAKTPADAVRDKDFCVCMVATAQQAQEVLISGEMPAIQTLPKGAVVLLCSTVPCSYVQGLEKELASIGREDILLVDSPVSGGAFKAADGTLSIMAGGSDAAIEKSMFVLNEMADPKKLYIVKGGVGAGSNMKMVHQVLAAIQILSASEAMGLASRLGLDMPATAKAILNSAGRSWMFEHRSPRILHPNFQPLVSALNIIVKDTGIITAEARRNAFPTPLASTAEQVYFSGLARGYGPDDDSGMIRLYTGGSDQASGLPQVDADDEAKTALVIALLKGIHLCAAGETIAFASRLGLDLHQVLDLCQNAAGGSSMLDNYGPDMIEVLAGQTQISQKDSLVNIAKELEGAVNAAQARKVPIYLGSAALNIIYLAIARLSTSNSEPFGSSIVKFWGS